MASTTRAVTGMDEDGARNLFCCACCRQVGFAACSPWRAALLLGTYLYTNISFVAK